MKIYDIHGNQILHPDLNTGHIEKAVSETENGEETFVFVYFPYDKDEQELFDLKNKQQIQTDEAICELYEMIAGEQNE